MTCLSEDCPGHCSERRWSWIHERVLRILSKSIHVDHQALVVPPASPSGGGVEVVGCLTGSERRVGPYKSRVNPRSKSAWIPSVLGVTRFGAQRELMVSGSR